MGHDILDQPSLGSTALRLGYRKIGDGAGMDPTVSRAMDDRDRMDWLERSITSIRKVLADNGINIEQLESGYGKVLSRVGDTNDLVDSLKSLTVRQGSNIDELIAETGKLARTTSMLDNRVDNLSTGLQGINELQLQTNRKMEDLEGRLILQYEETNTALNGMRDLMEIIATELERPKWWQFWLKSNKNIGK